MMKIKEIFRNESDKGWMIVEPERFGGHKE